MLSVLGPVQGLGLAQDLLCFTSVRSEESSSGGGRRPAHPRWGGLVLGIAGCLFGTGHAAAQTSDGIASVVRAAIDTHRGSTTSPASARRRPNAHRRSRRARSLRARSRVRPRGAPGSRSRSVGQPHRGRLQAAVRLHETDYLRYVASEVRGRRQGNFWGTQELVNLVDRVGQRISYDFPGTRLAVGELSRQRGGRLAGHRSHQAGRDADLGFYVRDSSGQPAEPHAFVRIGADGSGVSDGRRLWFDAEANWQLIAGLLTDGSAHVHFIFVARHLQRRLLEEARRRRAPEDLVQRARQVFREPDRHRHDNHFHIRVRCARDDRPYCRDDAHARPARLRRARRPRTPARRASPARLPVRIETTPAVPDDPYADFF